MSRRGSTLLEILFSSVLLIVGLVGVIQLLHASSALQRKGAQTLNAALYGQQNSGDFAELGFSALAAGVFDGGVTYDSMGRRFGRIVTVVDVSTDAGYPSYEINVRVETTTLGSNAPYVTTSKTIVSAIPDAG